MEMPSQEALDFAVLRRESSPFAADIANAKEHIQSLLKGKRVLVVGGGGTIGSATIGLIAGFSPDVLHVVDQSENYLAELVRTLRGRPEGLDVREFRTLPLDYGSPVMGRYLAEMPSFDHVLNFAALKHVRSEKDIYSLLQMLDTNIVRHIRFRGWLKAHGHGQNYFAVSTDKAANPTSVMGASKRLMEEIVFDESLQLSRSKNTTARFANVAFSNGSLLQGFISRLSKRQPLAAPKATRRYFVSQEESGEICLLSSMLGRNSNILFPKLDPRTELQEIEEIAIRVLAAAGFEAVIFDDEDAARASVAPLSKAGKYPLLLTPLDTSGEKPYEEFVGMGELPSTTGLQSLDAVQYAASGALDEPLKNQLERLVSTTEGEIDKATMVTLIQRAIPAFNHRETGKNLDDRL